MKHDYSCDELNNLLAEHADPDGDQKASNRYSDNEYRLGVSTAEIRKLAKQAQSDFAVADCLWRKGSYEARVLAVLLCPPNDASPDLVASWLKETQSWAICDLIANDLVSQNDSLFGHVDEWSRADAEFLKRGALAAIACRAQDRTQLSETRFSALGTLIWAAADDPRKYVKSAASWALREMGKVDVPSKNRAIKLASKMAEDTTSNRQWVGRDALKELETLIKVPERPRLLSSKSAVGKRYAK